VTARASDLAPREIQTLRLVARGLSIRDMTRVMGVNRGSIQSYLGAIAGKWGTADRSDMVRIGRQLGIVTDTCHTCGRP
jgi:DNA-binding CsgD family transcriptional regulator